MPTSSATSPAAPSTDPHPGALELRTDGDPDGRSARRRRPVGVLLASSLATSWASVGARTAQNISATALAVLTLAPAELSVWYLFSTLLVVSSLLDLGFQPTVTRLVAYDLAPAGSHRQRQDVIRQMARRMSLPYAVLSVGITAVLAVGGGLVLRTPISHVQDQGAAWAAFLLLVLGAGTLLNGRKYDALGRGMGETARMNRFDIIGSLTGALLLAVALLAGHGLVAMTAAWQIGLLTATGLKRRWLCRELGELRRLPGWTPPGELGEIWRPAWRTGILALSAQATTGGSCLVLANLLPPHEVAGYLLALRVMTIVCELSAAPVLARIPEFSLLRARRESVTFRSRAQAALRAALLTHVALSQLAGLALATGLAIVDLPVGFVGAGLWALMSLAWFAERQATLHAQLYMTTNDVPFHVPYLVTIPIQFTLLVLLAPRLGVSAAVVSQLGAQALIVNWFTVKRSLAAMGMPFAAYARTVLGPPSAALATLVVVAVALEM